MTGKRHWLWILLAAVIFIGIWQFGDRSTLERLTFPEELLDEPDLYVSNTEIRQFDAEGRLAYELRAGEARVYEATGLALLEEPRLTIHRPPDPPWQVRARHGKLELLNRGTDAQRDRVQLSEAVELYQREADGGFLRLRTDYLDIHPGQQYALSDQTVIIDSDAGRTTATGLLAHLEAGRFLVGASARAEMTAFYLAMSAGLTQPGDNDTERLLSEQDLPADSATSPDDDAVTDTADPDTVERVHTIVEPQLYQNDA